MTIIEAMWYKHRTRHHRLILVDLGEHLALVAKPSAEYEAIFAKMALLAILIDQVKMPPMDVTPELFVWEPPTDGWIVVSDTLAHPFSNRVRDMLPRVWSAQDDVVVGFVGDTNDDLIELLALAMGHGIALWSPVV